MKTLKLILFYILSFTWGILVTSYGCICALVMLIIGKKPEKFHNRIYFRVGKDWGGFEAGPFFFCDETPTLELKQHECGHGIQNIVLGPLTPFLVSLPSALRYWMREFRTQKGKKIFTSITLSVIGLISLGLLILGIVKHLIPLIIFFSVFLTWSIAAAIWMFVFEIPKYAYRYVPYDEAIFEKNATELGKKYFPVEK